MMRAVLTVLRVVTVVLACAVLATTAWAVAGLVL